MTPLASAQQRVARRALIGAEALPVRDRIQLFEDVALLLPFEEAELSRIAAFALKEAEGRQRTFLHLVGHHASGLDGKDGA